MKTLIKQLAITYLCMPRCGLRTELNRYKMKKVIVGKSKGLADAEQCDIHVVSKSLPKRLSNRAYRKAKTLRYDEFVKWWDEQV